MLKRNVRTLFSYFITAAFAVCCSVPLHAQAIDPERSAKAAAFSDTRFITWNIQDNKDNMILSQKALERSSDSRVKELAQKMIGDHTEILYALQEIKAAGSGAANDNAEAATHETHMLAARTDARLAGVSGADFDTMWVSDMLVINEAKFAELSQAVATVMNPQLKTAITEAIPKIRKNREQLRMLQKYQAKMAQQKKKQAATHRQ